MVLAALYFSYCISRSVYLFTLERQEEHYKSAQCIWFHEQQRYPVLFVAQEGPRKTVNNIEEPLLGQKQPRMMATTTQGIIVEDTN